MRYIRVFIVRLLGHLIGQSLEEGEEYEHIRSG